MTRAQRTVCQTIVATSAIIALASSAQAASAGGELIGDPFLNYFALGLLCFVVVVLFYGIIAIHDIPAKIAHSRHHPHEDAIHAAGWVSLFTLHVLWPFLWIWAMAYQPERGWGIHHPAGDAASRDELENLRTRLAALEGRLATNNPLESDAPPTAPAREREAAR
jgi:Protein of unknown function (DUF3302)